MANHCSLLLSSVMMLEYFAWYEAANLITNAMEETFAEGKATVDPARVMSNGLVLNTENFAIELIHKL